MLDVELEKKWREDFEANIMCDSFTRDKEGFYHNYTTNMAWVSYFAARKAAQVEIDELKLIIKELTNCNFKTCDKCFNVRDK